MGAQRKHAVNRAKVERCTVCGKKLPPRQPGVGGRKRLYCDKACRAKKYRSGGQGKDAAIVPIEGTDAELVTVVTEKLRQHGRLRTVEGQQAVVLARIMSAKFVNASGIASTSRELRTVLLEALAGVEPQVLDPIDQLRKAREAKAAAGA